MRGGGHASTTAYAIPTAMVEDKSQAPPAQSPLFLILFLLIYLFIFIVVHIRIEIQVD